MKFVSVIMGSKSDYEVMSECLKVLDNFGVRYEVLISSAHRSPQRTHDYIKDAESRGVQVFIGAAGMAAHLAGAIISQTTKPVIGVPLKGGILDGLDALLSTLQMPSSMPVATMAVGKAGAINAAYLATQILSLNDENLAQKLRQDRLEKQEKVAQDSASIEVLLSSK
ncbi:5-(carboxyamino)imidazole ribonucleotide mutase [Helicobacter sp. MIT 01-3238]|uniref:5-(carboxyamino)imidazole ribonucleotide mutase n=1 Tax=Helicobacter sp. MIT 01-3238 TaxID=398627 RepID=UPI000E1E5BBB|nr:5-(carboxyamino)imidazole ribonucleotide mutase [Helicobacter sp. MIT 01-3238]RDU55709.1 5-(carboxyamino)imidazole ribonucleotide mutase [Helicobacter sp. MIT 01-3238]